MTSKRIVLVLLLISVYTCITFSQNTYYVSPSGSDASSGSIASPLKTIQGAVNKAAAKDIIYIRAGTYRESIVINKDKNGLNLLAYQGEKPFIKGSVPVTGWVQIKNYWKKYLHVQTQQVMVNGDNPLQQIGYPNSDYETNQSYPRYEYPVGSGLKDMAPGRFFWQNDTIYIMLKDGGNPNNQQSIEVSQLGRLLQIDAADVHVKGLYFRHTNNNTFDEFGSAVGLGDNTLIEDCDVQWCDFGGISMGHMKSGAKAIRCNASNNGATGFSASAHFNFLISNCKANYNNYRNFYAQWNAGGFKAATSAWGTIENSEFAYNIGAGIWFDYCYQMPEYRTDGQKPIIVRNNYIHDNSKTDNKNSALMIEVSEMASLQNNLIINNDYRGIYIASSWNCDIINNTVANTQQYYAIDLNGMPRESFSLANNYVANNILYNNNTSTDLEILKDNGTTIKNNISDYNLIYRSGGSIKMKYGSTTYSNIDDWKKNVPFNDHSISTNPDFIDAKLHPSSNSPVIDAGTGSSTKISEKDFDGNARLTGSRVDLGVYEIKPSIITAIDEVPIQEQDYLLFPNPATNHIQIRYGEISQRPEFMRVYSLNGQKVMDVKLEDQKDQKIEINLAAGLYIIQLGTGDKIAYTKKMIVL
jgi:parallel beta-helix repeat protein